MKVYIVRDYSTEDSEIKSIHKSMTSAREALVDVLVNDSTMSISDWREYTHACGYGSVEEFIDAMLIKPTYDDIMCMRVEEWEVLD